MDMLEAVKVLREKTSVGMMECKEALKESNGDIEKAVEILRKKGIAKAAKKATRAASQGVIESYIHMGNKIGVLLEVNCETDFVARNDDFRMMVKEIAMQVAAANPLYVTPGEIPAEVIEKEKEIARTQIPGNKPKEVIEKIVNGRIEKYYSETCLLEQPFIKDPNLKVKDLVTQLVLKIGENIVVRRFTRYALGEEA
ncbi:MAG TPA: translation elongation factor Ts [Candidatus Omnitrophota bacterium]|nr:translation elongation factor Ts [Candidatus Omnitrophota bacterium]HPS20679.1 translation elongation factor Ts [Candidatus Omnitrophota bacterium]